MPTKAQIKESIEDGSDDSTTNVNSEEESDASDDDVASGVSDNNEIYGEDYYLEEYEGSVDDLVKLPGNCCADTYDGYEGVTFATRDNGPGTVTDLVKNGVVVGKHYDGQLIV